MFRQPGQFESIGSKACGWTVPIEKLKPSSICYCFGCGEDVSFDVELVNRFGCEVWSYDPTPRAITHIAEAQKHLRASQNWQLPGSDFVYSMNESALGKWHFEPLGVWSKSKTMRFFEPTNSTHVSHSILNLQKTENYFEAECKTIAELMQENGHDHVDLIKLDIEGAEYEVISSLKRDDIRPSILCVEFDEGHNPSDDDAPHRIEEAIRAIRSMGYGLVHRKNWDFTFIL